MNRKHSEYLEKVKKDVVESGFLTDELISFYNTVFEYQESVEFEEKSGFSFIKTDSFPAIDMDSIKFSAETKSRLFESLKNFIEIIKKSQDGLKFDLFLDAFDGDKPAYEESLKLLLNRDPEKIKGVADELKIGADEYIFIVLNWLKPYFTGMREDLFKDADTSEWLGPVCPFCGYYPDMAKIVADKENQRVLHCGFCENEWKYKRIACTVCENENSDSLGYLTTEDDSRYRVDFCDECKGYIKTIRIPKLVEESRYDLTVENIITTYLDASAINLGYNRP